MSIRRNLSSDIVNTDDWHEGLVFALKTLNTKSVTRAETPETVLLVCLRHNLRRDNGDHRHRRPIDPALTEKNSILLGATSPDGGALEASQTLERLGIRPGRVDAIMGIELVIQPPPGWDDLRFYEHCLSWVAGRCEHVVSAVVHRDQARPHLHVLVLPVRNGRLDGAAMTQKENRLEAQRSSFMAFMREMTGLRPDRKAKTRSMAAIFTSQGHGPKTRAEAARRDAQLARRVAARAIDLMAHEPHSPRDLMATTSSCAALAEATRLFKRGVERGLFCGAAVAPIAPAPRPSIAEPALRLVRESGCLPGLRPMAAVQPLDATSSQALATRDLAVDFDFM